MGYIVDTCLIWSGNQISASSSCRRDYCKRWFSIKSRWYFSDWWSQRSGNTLHFRTNMHRCTWNIETGSFTNANISVNIFNLTAFLSACFRSICWCRYSSGLTKMAFWALYQNTPYTRLPSYFMVERWYSTSTVEKIVKQHLQIAVKVACLKCSSPNFSSDSLIFQF
jgi:hypothetical protein